VAVKVQHKWIKENVGGDLQMIQFGVDVAKLVFPDFKYAWLADEFKTRLPRELDFAIEAENAKRCDKMFEGNKQVHVPKVYDQFTRTRVLVMSFEQGISVAHVKEMHRQGIDLKALA
jgi:predicted unusual protein kinase regulating ubiquinone biosynthesis (AarF/ABC1/UbiB family)